MSLDYEAFDVAISKRLESVRTELANADITVAALPKQPGELGKDEFESVDWLFATLEGLPRETKEKRQPVKVGLTVRLMFDNRYVDDEDLHKAALEWAEIQILSLLVMFRLPGARTDILLDNARLFAPEAGRWFKELRFSFEAYINAKDKVPELPKVLVKQIDIKDCGDNELLGSVTNGK